jgi:hypothetical protein
VISILLAAGASFVSQNDVSVVRDLISSMRGSSDSPSQRLPWGACGGGRYAGGNWGCT